MSKPGGVALNSELIIKAAKLCSNISLILHDKLNIIVTEHDA